MRNICSLGNCPITSPVLVLRRMTTERSDCASKLSCRDLPAVRSSALIASMAACVAAGDCAAASAALAAFAAADDGDSGCRAVESEAPFDGNEAASGAGVAPSATGSIAVPRFWANQCLTGS